MKTKILLADDSLTIQKVIDITLNNEPFELNICSNEEEYLNKINMVKPSILLLDFNLSSEKTGFDLVREAREALPNIKIMLLFGTFDTVDEEKLKTENIDAHIVKPFDGSKFITLCKVLADGDDEPKVSPKVNVQDSTAKIEINQIKDEDQNWELNEDKIEIKAEASEKISTGITKTTKLSLAESNQLLKDIEDWGMEIPPIISAHESMDDFKVEFPPIIGEGTFDGKSEELVQAKVEIEEDLESLVYDDEPNNEDKTNTSLTIDRNALKGDDLIVEEDPIINAKKEEAILESKLEIIEEKPVENFWTADEDEDSQENSIEEIDKDDLEIEFEKNDEKKPEVDQSEFSNPNITIDKELFLEEDLNDVHLEIENTAGTQSDIKINFEESTKTDSKITTNDPEENNTGFKEIKFDPKDLEENAEVKVSASDSKQIDIDEIANQVVEKLRPELKELIEELVLEKLDELLVKGVDSVAWEVIPDLAENLIKDQLQKITDNVLEDQH